MFDQASAQLADGHFASGDPRQLAKVFEQLDSH